MQISVIIPTYNRYESLKNMLRALERQDYPPDQFEVFVVDDGSKDETHKIVEESFHFKLRYHKQANQGATVARNFAAEQASGELLVFLDDDIYVEPGFLSALAQAHQEECVLAVGNLQPMPRESMSLFEAIYSKETATPPSSDGKEIVPVGFTDVLTGMFSVKRRHFYEIGRLQDLVGDGRVAWGDVDFGYRASKLGFRFLRCMKAVGYHDDYSIRDFLKCAQRWERTSESAVKLFQVYPEIQPHLPMFEDKKPVAWGFDKPWMVVRKFARGAASTRPVIRFLERTVEFAEKRPLLRGWLSTLYRWVIGGYIFRGYRAGLEKYAKVL